ncbi:hypothetical protein GUJ93_ZPchr0001g29742 [Zizania palustris]|uniref:Thioredoxin domain-containing protein n=1 Tax=Zizania palustris TaxID=103762 RepID=A0A8J5VLW7_ZIZPA|nr:hypothetical protein GUJ93_ZPchr0001g29742 [Zizania palustris]
MEIVAKEKGQAASASHDKVDLDELLDDPELEKLHAERMAALKNAPFFVTKLGIKTLPCVILFKKGIAVDRLIGFQDLGSKDDFSTRALENILRMTGIIDKNKKNEDNEDDETEMSMNRRIRSSTAEDSDLD